LTWARARLASERTQGLTADAPVAGVLAIQQRSRGPVAQAPQAHPRDRWKMALQGIDGRGDVGAGIVEIAMLAAAVPHAAVVESQCGDADRGKRAAQQHELPVAAGTVLRTAHHDHDTQRGGDQGRHFFYLGRLPEAGAFYDLAVNGEAGLTPQALGLPCKRRVHQVSRADHRDFDELPSGCRIRLSAGGVAGKCGAAAIEAEYFIEHAQDFLGDVQWGLPDGDVGYPGDARGQILGWVVGGS